MKYKIVEKDNHNAVHSIGYYDKEKAQEKIDSGECIKYWKNKEAQFEVIRDDTSRNTCEETPPPITKEVTMETKADWLRSEIERLEGMKKDIPMTRIPFEIAESVGAKMTIDSIITRYKEELKELTGE